MKVKVIALITMVFLFVGCDVPNEVDQEYLNTDSESKSYGRFKLEKIQTFRDVDSYNGNRSIFILTDKSTGREYVGISGIGISEMGSHSNGKTTSSDER